MNHEYTLFGQPIERLERPFCNRCSELLRDGRYQLCFECHKNRDTLHFGIIRAPGIYRSRKKDGNILSEKIKRFKYHSVPDDEKRRIAEEFATLLCKYSADEKEILYGVDFIIPVPMTRKKEEQKGFNHVKMITEIFSKKVGIEAQCHNLVKMRETRDQINLDKAGRCENVGGAFAVMQPQDLRGKKVLLIDDVVTTCATVNECARVLKNAGTHEVNVLALARDTRLKGDSRE